RAAVMGRPSSPHTSPPTSAASSRTVAMSGSFPPDESVPCPSASKKRRGTIARPEKPGNPKLLRGLPRCSGSRETSDGAPSEASRLALHTILFHRDRPPLAVGPCMERQFEDRQSAAVVSRPQFEARFTRVELLQPGVRVGQADAAAVPRVDA